VPLPSRFLPVDASPCGQAFSSRVSAGAFPLSKYVVAHERQQSPCVHGVWDQACHSLLQLECADDDTLHCGVHARDVHQVQAWIPFFCSSLNALACASWRLSLACSWRPWPFPLASSMVRLASTPLRLCEGLRCPASSMHTTFTYCPCSACALNLGCVGGMYCLNAPR
jgi:hypothetical protein